MSPVAGFAETLLRRPPGAGILPRPLAASALAVRVVLGGLFVWAGVLKLSHPRTFAHVVDEYGVVPDGWPLVIAAFAIPTLELLAGVAVLLDRRRKTQAERATGARSQLRGGGIMKRIAGQAALAVGLACAAAVVLGAPGKAVAIDWGNKELSNEQVSVKVARETVTGGYELVLSDELRGWLDAKKPTWAASRPGMRPTIPSKKRRSSRGGMGGRDMKKRTLCEVCRVAVLVLSVALASGAWAAEGSPVATSPAKAEAPGVEISTEELKQILLEGRIPVIDVRPEKEFGVSHIPGAVNIFETEIQRMMEACPDKSLGPVLYCNGPLCHKTGRVAENLAKNGFTHARHRLREDRSPGRQLAEAVAQRAYWSSGYLAATYDELVQVGF